MKLIKTFMVTGICCLIFCSGDNNNSTHTVISGEINAGKANLQYEEMGSGKPVVLIHAGLLNMSMWDGQFDLLAQKFRTVRYDVRNHGRSVSEADTFTHYEDLHKLVTALNLKKPVLIGLSMGGYIAIDYALNYPDEVSALILASPGLTGFQFQGTEFDEYIQRYREAAATGNIEKIIDVFQSAWTIGPFRTPAMVDSGLIASVKSMALQTARNFNRAAIEKQFDPPAVNRLHEIRVPVLVIEGSLDMPPILEINNLILKQVPNAKKIVFPNAAHMVNLEEPEKFNNAVMEFLKGL